MPKHFISNNFDLYKFRVENNCTSINYNLINGARIQERPSTSIPLKQKRHWNGRKDVLSGIFKDSRVLAPHYLKKNREMISQNQRAFFKTNGEFTKVYELAHKNKFIRPSPF